MNSVRFVFRGGGTFSFITRRPLSLMSPCFTRFRINGTQSSSPVKALGRLVSERELPYASGQVFIHKVFAYRGAIIWSFRCPVVEEDTGLLQSDDLYQVLIHKGDWTNMKFSSNWTSWLSDGSTGRGQMAHVQGMDCVSHSDIIPYQALDHPPIDHEFYDEIFDPNPLPESDEVSSTGFVRKEMQEFCRRQTFLTPQKVHRITLNGVCLTVVTFYLGPIQDLDHLDHYWRFAVRLHNFGTEAVSIRGIRLTAHGPNFVRDSAVPDLSGCKVRLWSQEPACQFASVIQLPYESNVHMRIKFKLERDNGFGTFDLGLSSIAVEVPGREVIVEVL